MELALFALEARQVPAAFLDDKGRVFSLNGSARALLGLGLRVNNGRLFTEHRESDAELRRLVGVLSTPAGASFIAAEPIVIMRPGRRALLLEIVSTVRAFPGIGAPVVALLLMTDLEQGAPVSEKLLRSAFGLTSAEARLARSLGEGNDLRSTCHLLGIANETARSQLKAVFTKTHTHRQSELISLLSRMQSGAGARRSKPGLDRAAMQEPAADGTSSLD